MIHMTFKAWLDQDECYVTLLHDPETPAFIAFEFGEEQWEIGRALLSRGLGTVEAGIGDVKVWNDATYYYLALYPNTEYTCTIRFKLIDIETMLNATYNTCMQDGVEERYIDAIIQGLLSENWVGMFSEQDL